MVRMKSSWQIGQTISIIYAILTMTYQSRYPVIHMLVNRSVFVSLQYRGGKSFFFWSPLAACHGINSKLIMSFTVNTAFINYLDHFPNLTVP